MLQRLACPTLPPASAEAVELCRIILRRMFDQIHLQHRTLLLAGASHLAPSQYPYCCGAACTGFVGCQLGILSHGPFFDGRQVNTLPSSVSRVPPVAPPLPPPRARRLWLRALRSAQAPPPAAARTPAAGGPRDTCTRYAGIFVLTILVCSAAISCFTLVRLTVPQLITSDSVSLHSQRAEPLVAAQLDRRQLRLGLRQLSEVSLATNL